MTSSTAPIAPALAAAAAAPMAAGAITAFENWAETAIQSNHTPTPAEIAVGTQLAQARRVALKQLIQSDPRQALAHAIRPAMRQALPPQIRRELETPVDAFGHFEVLSVCGPTVARVERWTTVGSHTYATFTYGARLGTMTKAHLPVHGIAVDDVLALADLPYAPLQAADMRTAASTAVSVTVGDEVRTFASPQALQAWVTSAQATEQSPGPTPTVAALPAGWTTGTKRVLWIRGEFPDDSGSPMSDDQINAAMAAADAFYRDVSHGATSLATTILPGTIMLPATKTAYGATASGYLTLRADALQLARAYDAANGGTGTYNPDKYDRYVVITKDVPTWTWGGIGSIGAAGVSLNGPCTGSLLAHELGHNMGLQHAHGWQPTAGSAIGAGTHIEYGDAFDVMGSAQAGDTAGHFNAIEKHTLGYLTDAAVQTVAQSGTYRIYRHDDPSASGIQALKIASASAGTNYWFEYRHAAPDASFSPPWVGTDPLPRLQNGVVIHWDKGPSFTSGSGTYLLDMTPSTTSGVKAPTNPSTDITALLNDAPLALGESFADPATNLIVTPIRVGGTAPNEWIEVYVSLARITGNHAPSLTTSPPSDAVTARTDVTLTASATDPDGDAVYFHWDFGDGTIAPCTATPTHRWLQGGTYTVSCTATDGRGGSITSTFNVNVADPLIAWQRQASSLTTKYFSDVLFDGTKFVAVGTYITATSTDGITWTLGAGTALDGNYSVAYGQGRYVAVGWNPASATITSSTDGVSWTDGSVPLGVTKLYSVRYGAGHFVAVGAGGVVLTSTDGLSWTNVATSNANDLQVVRYGGGRFVAAGKNGAFLTSTDGVTWQDVSRPGETSSTYGLVYFKSAWFATTDSYPVMDPSKLISWTSPDGVNWSKTVIGVDTTSWNLLPLESGQLLLAVGTAKTGRIFYAENVNGPWASANVFPASAADASSYIAAAAEGNGTIVLVGFEGQIYTPAGQPFIGTAPTNATVTAGGIATFDASGFATGPFTFQWLKNGAAIPGATTSTYAVANVGSGDAASYSATISNSSGSVTTSGGQLVVTSAGQTVNPSRLSNVSVRSTAGTGDQTLIVGVSIGAGGSGVAKPLLVRAVGPTLASYGLNNALSAPVLASYQLGATVPLATNDGWRGDVRIGAVAKAVNAFTLDSTSADAALYRSFDDGAYTMQVTGNNGTGVALVEVYDATGTNGYLATTPRLLNVSARTQVGTGNDVLIVGFSIAGEGSRRLLIRAAGPSLARWVSGTLADPKLELHRQDTGALLMQNDDWNNDAAITTAGNTIGAFPLDPGSKDAALLVDLQPGTYSVVVSGVGDTTGVALAEVYDVSN